MSNRRHRIEIARDLFKFSCAHMTVFPDGTKERLHGHNYYLSLVVEVSDISFAQMVPFAPIKAEAMDLCAAWKERTIIGERNPHFEKLASDPGEYAFKLCGQRYVFPAEDVLPLPIDNVSVEQLSDHVATLLIERLGEILRPAHVTAFEVLVTESPGQGARTIVEL